MDQQKPSNSQDKAPTVLQEASQATAHEDYDDYIGAKRPVTYTASRHKFRKVFLAVLIVVLLGAAGYGAYWFLVKNKKSSPAPTKQQSTSSEAATNETLFTTETDHYVSNRFMLEFDHPKDWEVSEPETGGVVTAKSPAISLKQSGGKVVSGQVIFTIRNKQQALPEFDKGNATAALTSEKISYKKPSSVQRGDTYLSFLTYAGTAQASRLDGIYITGDVGYQKGQAIPKADFTPVDPVISVTFAKCSNEACDQSAAMGLDAAMWQEANLSGPIKSLAQSLVIN